MKTGDLVRWRGREQWIGVVVSLCYSFGVRREKEDKALVYFTNGTKGEPWIKDLEVISEAK